MCCKDPVCSSYLQTVPVRDFLLADSDFPNGFTQFLSCFLAVSHGFPFFCLFRPSVFVGSFGCLGFQLRVSVASSSSMIFHTGLQQVFCAFQDLGKTWQVCCLNFLCCPRARFWVRKLSRFCQVLEGPPEYACFQFTLLTGSIHAFIPLLGEPASRSSFGRSCC